MQDDGQVDMMQFHAMDDASASRRDFLETCIAGSIAAVAVISRDFTPKAGKAPEAGNATLAAV
ncbi:MAG: hypothetical protein ACYDDO_04240 [Acidiferrobacterales bacterium]